LLKPCLASFISEAPETAEEINENAENHRNNSSYLHQCQQAQQGLSLESPLLKWVSLLLVKLSRLWRRIFQGDRNRNSTDC